MSNSNLNLDLERYCGATLVRNTHASVLIIVLVNATFWHLSGDIQSIFPTSQFTFNLIYDVCGAFTEEPECICCKTLKILSRVSPLDVGSDPRHAEMTLLALFMICLSPVNIVVNTPLGFRELSTFADTMFLSRVVWTYSWVGALCWSLKWQSSFFRPVRPILVIRPYDRLWFSISNNFRWNIIFLAGPSAETWNMHLIFQSAVKPKGGQVSVVGFYVASKMTIVNECSNKTVWLWVINWRISGNMMPISRQGWRLFIRPHWPSRTSVLLRHIRRDAGEMDRMQHEMFELNIVQKITGQTAFVSIWNMKSETNLNGGVWPRTTHQVPHYINICPESQNTTYWQVESVTISLIMNINTNKYQQSSPPSTTPAPEDQTVIQSLALIVTSHLSG